ncbi:chromatin assembly protein [Zalerion maritima]|uniref:Chromatin assembly protein n=1 Tax=Zalerion maritima TaxID=339359 RepID=A0AAD5WWS4_9PEZI|nr:chromatin assembly protein [Zalerion maritima]
MVLFKRKPVRFLAPPKVDGHAEVWHIPQTGEIFATYEEYLSRMDFYRQATGAQEVEQAFPEALKGPVLRKVQFSTVSRIDALVDKIFEEFRTDYYPGETVTVIGAKGDRVQGIVRDKTRFGAKVQPDGTVIPPYSRYIVLIEKPDEEMMVEESNICRDRKVFTKAVLRSFIKKTVTREAWNGAPWLVKDNVAETHGIDTKVPEELQLHHKLQERKQQLLLKKAEQHDPNGSFTSEPARLPDLKPHPKSLKGKGAAFINAGPGFANGHQFPVSIRNGLPLTEPLPPPPPPPKYPIEDLQVPPRDRPSRPLLKYWCRDPPVRVEDGSKASSKILMKSIGPLLETWDTLNVYCEIFKLDSFTFDDFAEAMEIASGDLEVQLFDEIHCSVLKIIVNEQGNTEVALPEVDEEEEDEEEEEKEPTPEPEPRPTTRATRRSLAKLEAERLAAEAAAAEKEKENLEPDNSNRAAELLNDYDWVDELSKRKFKNGGWEAIMVGLLYRLSFNPRYKESCDALLAQLVPSNVEPTQETVREHYSNLDINYRIQGLQIICMLTTETKAVRGYMEECSTTMTGYRKEKIEWQRQRKDALEEVKALNDQRRLLLPDPLPRPMEEGNKPEAKEDGGKTTDAEESMLDHTNTEDTDEDAHLGRSLRRGPNRAADRKKKLEEEHERREKEKELAKQPKQPKQLIKVLKEIQKKDDLIKNCEDEIAILDNDLREADCPRTRVLGKDRFWNRYYWFERNGMPYAGLPNSSTAEAGYANGMIWVQGPDDIEREGYIEMDPKHQEEYQAKFGLTVPERKRKEEGATAVFNARQWGYYSEPHEVEALIKWLDARGYNEMRLRKELVNYRERIQNNMRKRDRYVHPHRHEEDEQAQPKRSTRGRTHQTPEPVQYKCLRWENTTALEEFGHLHSELPPPPRKKAKKQR